MRIGLLPLIFLLAGSTCAGGAPLSLPDLWIKAENRNLDLVSVSMSVRLEGALAETVLELEYFNQGRRNAEGEFSMKLPEGATVSTYALEVNGKMRPGVAVEKEQARFAYESIKSRNVDPGIVERQAGNVYRTRIFPIFPQKGKKVRIGFIHPLADGTYRYEFDRPKKVKRFSLSVSGTVEGQAKLLLGGTSRSLADASPEKPWTAQELALTGSLTCQSVLPSPGALQTRFDLDKKGNLYFVAQGSPEREAPANSLADWEEVTLIWDTSHSGARRDHRIEFDALRRLFPGRNPCKVKVHFLGNDLGKEKIFTIADGGVEELLRHLEGAVYFGVADFSKLPSHPGPILLFSDGHVPLPRFRPPPRIQGERIYLCHPGSKRISPHFAGKLAAALNLTEEPEADGQNPDGWWKKLHSHRTFLAETTLPRRLWNHTSTPGTFIISGKVPSQDIGNARFKLPSGEEIPFGKHRESAGTADWNFSRRVWAEQSLSALEEIGSESEIREFAIRERLVSDHTSLIVLETFRDHLRYDIPPPEPDLLEKYRRAKGRAEKDAMSLLEEKWERKKDWHTHPFPWFDLAFQEQVDKAQIWVAASHAGFTEKNRNGVAVDGYEEWVEGAIRTGEKRESIEAGKEFVEWLQEVDRRLTELQRLRTTAPVADPNNDVHVSVRGYVNIRGVFSGKAPFTLQEAIDEAGAGGFLGRERVFLYRGLTRTGYNLLHPALKPVPLQWGDMIVVDAPEPPRSWLGTPAMDPFGGDPAGPAVADPFAAPSPEPAASAGSGPAVFETPLAGNGGFEAGRWDEDEGTSSGFRRRYSLPVPWSLPADFFGKLKKHPDKRAFLETTIRKNGTLSIPDTIRIARILSVEKDPGLAREVLFQLLELVPHPLEGPRSLAYWLAEIGQQDSAREVLLDLLKETDLDHRTRAVIAFDLAQITGEEAFYLESVRSDLRGGPTQIGVIALTDFFRLGDKDFQEIANYRMTGDFRIVVTSMGQPFRVKVRVPPRFEGLLTDQSSRQVSVPGLVEHQSIKALPGKSTVELNAAEPGTYHVVILRKYGSDREKIVERRTFYLEKGTEKKIGEIDFGWTDIELDEATLKRMLLRATGGAPF